jgi:hypothetical protein
MLEGKIVPLSVRQARAGDDVSKSHHVVRTDPPPGSLSLRAAPPVSQASAKALEPSAVPTLTEIESNKGTLITHDAPIAPDMAPPSRGKLVAIGLSAVIGVAAVIAAVSSLGGGARRAGSATTDTASAAPARSGGGAAATAAAAAPDDGVDLVVVADAPIESVRAAGARSVEINGLRARVRVARWTGALAIDAVLASGEIAHATALEGTVGEVHLELSPAAPPTPTAKATTAKSGASRSGRQGSSPSGTQAPPELHPSPYGR